MRRMIHLTLLTDLIGCVIMFLIVILFGKPIHAFVLVFYFFFLSLFPIFLSAAIFTFLKDRIPFRGYRKTAANHILGLLIVLNLGVFLWALLETILFGVHSVSELYGEFSGYHIVASFIAIVMPLVNMRLTIKRDRLEQFYKELRNE